MLKSLLISGLVLLMTGLSQAAEPLQVRVLCYNIRHGRGADMKVDLERIAKVISSVNPDLVALQEVDSGVNRSNQINEPELLGKLTGLTPVFGPNIKYDGGDYGNAALSRWPVTSHTNHKLKSFYPKEQRGLLELEIALPDNRGPLTFYVTHLDYRGNSPERLPSAVTINEKVAEKPGRIAILTGDLNEPPTGSAIAELTRSIWAQTNEGELATFPVDVPTRQIDHILVTPKPRWKVIETRVLDDAIASDHRALLSVLVLQPAE